MRKLPALFTFALLTLSTATFAASSSYTASCNGPNGLDGRDGFGPIGSAPDGHRGFTPGGRGGDGQRGRDGGDASQATAGGSACPIDLLVEQVSAEPAQLRISGRVGGREVNELIDKTDATQIFLSANGGRGGNGGLGADGQNGGRGGEGGDAGQGSFSSGDGGRGGDGGSAGSSTSGANGGNGGTIVLRVRKGQEALASLVRASVSAGAGGRAPIGYPRGGRGGQGGQPGNNCYFSSEGYKCVSRGFAGMSGMDGRPSFGSPQSGAPGRPGSFTVLAVD